jgi:hypothetical protein
MLSTIDDSTLTKVALALGGEEAVQLIAHLKGVEEITDDEIANKTGIRLNSVRKIPTNSTTTPQEPTKDTTQRRRLAFHLSPANANGFHLKKPLN